MSFPTAGEAIRRRKTTTLTKSILVLLRNLLINKIKITVLEAIPLLSAFSPSLFTETHESETSALKEMGSPIHELPDTDGFD